jgi:hypothetical protein
MSPRSKMLILAKSSLDRLFGQGEILGKEDETPVEAPNADKPLAEKLEEKIAQSKLSKYVAVDDYSALKKEFQVYEATGKHTPNLKKIV